MKKTWAKFVLILALVLLASAYASALPVDPNSPLIPLDMRVLPNGLRVIVKEIPAYPVTAVNMWVEAGGKHDPPSHSGLAHFFEHLMFKGTETRPLGQIAYEVESVGGYLNAMTSLDYTTYFIVVPSEYTNQAMEIQADALRNSVFLQADIDQERTVIHEEIRMQQDRPQSQLTHMALEVLFEDTPYANMVLGTEEELANINHDEMVDFHSKYYVPNNMILVVAGDVKAETIFSQALDLYGDMEPKIIPAPEYVPLPELESVVRVSESRSVQQSYLFMGHPTPGLNTKEAAALTMAGSILGGGRSSRLYQRLVEDEELVNGISASYSGFSDMGIFGIFAQLRPEHVSQVEEILLAELVRLSQELVSDDELARARAMARSSLAFSTESNVNVAMFLGQMELFGGVMGAVNRIAILEQITAYDILRVAQTYLDPDAYVLSEIRPHGR